MSKVLVIGDVHQKIGLLEQALKLEPELNVVIMGDYFDDFDDNVFEVASMAEWLKININNPRLTLLMGNHDINYRVPKPGLLACSGFAGWKYETINKILTRDDWKNIKYFHSQGDTWFSHAGIVRHWFEHPVNGINVDVINNQIDRATMLVDAGVLQGAECLWVADKHRGGTADKGSCLWNNWSNSEFFDNVIQVVGHTPHKDIQIQRRLSSVNINVDTHLTSVMVLNTTTGWNEIIKL